MLELAKLVSMNPENKNTQQPLPEKPNDPTSLASVLASEASQATVDPQKLQEAVQKNDGASKDFNPYQQQQVKPGQIIGYGIPTDQKVEIPIIKGRRHLPRKFWRALFYFGIFLLVAVLLAGLALLGKKVANV